jgi:hypothetical protein
MEIQIININAIDAYTHLTYIQSNTPLNDRCSCFIYGVS